MSKPIFLISLPRSGSTWVQRLIARSNDIASSSEPWFMLPLSVPLLQGRIYAEYSQLICENALDEFKTKMDDPDGQAFIEAIGLAGQHIYNSYGQGKLYFLDKTPRYYLIIDELCRIFPDAKFILLLRDPADIAISMCRTWGGRYNTLFRYEIDFLEGLKKLADNRERSERFHTISYEQMIDNEAQTIDELGKFLDLDLSDDQFDEDSFKRLESQKVGDQAFKADQDQRHAITWGQKRAIRSLLKKVNPDIYHQLGYQHDISISKIDALKTGLPTLHDLLSLPAAWLYRAKLFPLLERTMLRSEPHANRIKYGFE